MVWQRIDDQFGVSQKIIRIPRKRRQKVVGLWTLSGNYSARNLTDGVLEVHELEELDASKPDIDELVRVGLWHRRGHSCDKCVNPPVGGVIIHDHLDYHPSREEVVAERERERVRKAAQRASRRSPSGTPDGTPGGTPDGRDAASGHPGPVPSRPDPSLVTDDSADTQSSPVLDRASNGPDWDEVISARAMKSGIQKPAAVWRLLVDVVEGPLSAQAVLLLVDAITRKSPKPIKNVDGYIAVVCQKNPEEVQHEYDRLDLEAA